MIPGEAVEEALARLPMDVLRYMDADDMRRALEAAAPHMLAAAWDEGDRNGADGIYEPNPYRTARNV